MNACSSQLHGTKSSNKFPNSDCKVVSMPPVVTFLMKFFRKVMQKEFHS